MKLLQDECYKEVKEVYKLKQLHLKLSQGKHARLIGLHTYDMLANPISSYCMQYVSAIEENRSDLIINGDDDISCKNA